MRKTIISGIGILLVLGCARVKVEAPKDPIKVDISMRLDIYQHVEKDIDTIEDMVSGTKGKAAASDKQSLLESFLGIAYAQEPLSPEVEQAALRRKDRHEALSSWETKGVVGENKSGLVEIRNSSGADASVNQLIIAENSDRMVIFQSVARKHGTSIEEVQKLFAKRLQDRAPSGTPIEALNDAGGYEWRIK